jgi:hypothetical protein
VRTATAEQSQSDRRASAVQSEHRESVERAQSNSRASAAKVRSRTLTHQVTTNISTTLKSTPHTLSLSHSTATPDSPFLASVVKRFCKRLTHVSSVCRAKNFTSGSVERQTERIPSTSSLFSRRGWPVVFADVKTVENTSSPKTLKAARSSAQRDNRGITGLAVF